MGHGANLLVQIVFILLRVWAITGEMNAIRGEWYGREESACDIEAGIYSLI